MIVFCVWLFPVRIMVDLVLLENRTFISVVASSQ